MGLGLEFLGAGVRETRSNLTTNDTFDGSERKPHGLAVCCLATLKLGETRIFSCVALHNHLS